MKNVLIVEGTSSGKYLPLEFKKQGYTPYHLLNFNDTIDINTLTHNEKEYYLSYVKNINYNDYKKCFKLSDYKNYNELLKELKKYNFKAVMSGGESGVEIAEKIATSLKTPTNDPLLAHTRRNKHEMQKRLKEVGLDYIPYIYTSNISDVYSFIKKNKYKRIVLKEVSGASSENVFICDNKKNIERSFNAILNSNDMYGNKNEKVLIEKFIEGEEFFIDSTVKNSQKNIIGVYKYKKIINERPVYNTCELVTKIDQKYLKAIEYNNKVLDTLGINNAITHSELKFDLETGKPVLIEVASRLAGNVNESVYVKKIFGYYEYEKAVDVFVNNNKYIYEKYNPDPNAYFMYKLLIFFSNNGKIFDHKKTLDYLYAINGVKEVSLDNRITKIKKTVDLDTSPGIVTICTKNLKTYNNAYKKIHEFEMNDFRTK